MDQEFEGYVKSDDKLRDYWMSIPGTHIISSELLDIKGARPDRYVFFNSLMCENYKALDIPIKHGDYRWGYNPVLIFVEWPNTM